MSPHRTTKSQSLRIEPKQPSNSTPRPSLGDRHRSAPLVPRKQQSATSRAHDDDAAASRTSRSSKHSSSRSANLQRDSTGSEHQTLRGTDAKPVLKLESIPPTTDHLFLKIVVVGNPGVGKSTFIRHALELRSVQSSAIASSWVSLRGIVYRVQMIELPLDDIEIEDGQYVQWPEYIDKVPFSSPDAVICLYDIVKRDSVDGIPQFLTALANLDVPVQLVPLDFDRSSRDSTAGTSFASTVKRNLPHVNIAEVEQTISQTAKKGMLFALRAVLGNQVLAPDQRRSSENGSSDHFDSAKTTPIPATTSQPTNDVSSISSEDEDGDNDSDDEEGSEMYASAHADMMASLQITNVEPSPTLPQAPQTPISETGPFAAHAFSAAGKSYTEVPRTPESYQHSLMRRPGTSDTTESRDHHTFFYGDDDSGDENSINRLAQRKGSRVRSDLGTDHGVPFPSLVERLLQLPANKQESKFVPTFLCLYRAFATPKELITVFLHRFTLMDASDDNQFSKVGELLRYLQIMAQWTATYPGDFADSTTREIVTNLVHDIEGRTSLAAAAKEISNNLQVDIEDEDASWAYGEPAVSKGAASRKCSVSTDDRYAAEDTEESETDDELKAMRSSLRNSGTASTVSSLLKIAPTSSQSATNLAVLDNARDQASKLRSIPHIGLSKLQWHFFMDTSTEDLARELARVDWIRYAAIRPRDFVREVFQPETRQTRNNISLMVKHFNQISFFVAGMILLRDKAKHRAKTVEKVMDLAWKVRQLNDYNCVSAIVAGMQNTAITRLSQTMDLVPTETQRQFMRLNVLVDATKSYATYRIAWENTSTARIPLIPSLQKDLKVAVLANPTFLGDNINWKKFEIMGDAILSIQKSQDTPYTFPEKTQQVQDIMRLFLETKIIEQCDDTVDPSKELYDRSKQLEPQTAGGDPKKRFDWLRR